MPRVATTLAFRGTGLKMVWGSSTHGGRQQKGVRCTHGGYHEIQQISGLPTLMKVTHMQVLPLLVLLGFTGCSHTSPYLASKDPALGGIPSLAPDYRLLLLGDAGDPRKGPVLPLLSDWASQFPRRSTVVFLGDNIYPEGITPERAHQADATILGPQVDAVTGSGADGVFVPGNHDWAYARSGDIGLHAVRRQADYINERLGGGSFLPEGGKPGPVVRDLPAENPSVRLVVLDNQWWLHSASKPAVNKATVLEELEKAVATELPVVIVAHHPLVSVGVLARRSLLLAGPPLSADTPAPRLLAPPASFWHPVYPAARSGFALCAGSAEPGQQTHGGFPQQRHEHRARARLRRRP